MDWCDSCIHLCKIDRGWCPNYTTREQVNEIAERLIAEKLKREEERRKDSNAGVVH